MQVTRGVCHKVLDLAAAGSLTAADVATALDANTIRLLVGVVEHMMLYRCIPWWGWHGSELLLTAFDILCIA